MAGRVVAFAVAIAMVVGSLALRSHLDRSGRTLRLTCSTELGPACQRLGHGVRVTVEPVGVTADRLTALPDGQDPGLDGWLAAGPWPANVDAARRAAARAPLFAGTTTSVATSPLVGFVESRRVAALRQSCNPLGWLCVAHAVGKRWSDLGGAPFAGFGAVKADIPDPATSATGVAVLGAMSDELFKGRSFDRSDDGLRALLAGLRPAARQPAADAMATVLTAPAVTDLVAGSEADALSVLDQAADRNAATVLYPSSVVVDVELGTVATGGAAGDLGRLVRGSVGSKALADSHWRPGPAAPGTTTDPGVLAALRAAWLS